MFNEKRSLIQAFEKASDARVIKANLGMHPHGSRYLYDVLKDPEQPNLVIVKNTGCIAINGRDGSDTNLVEGEKGPGNSFRFPKDQADATFVRI